LLIVGEQLLVFLQAAIFISFDRAKVRTGNAAVNLVSASSTLVSVGGKKGRQTA
jgi:hypothetical protein